MGYNLAIFAWRTDLHSAAQRKKAGVTFDEVYSAICEQGAHDAVASVDFGPFERELTKQLGSGPEAAYTLERYERARIVRIAYSDVPRLVIEIGKIARRCGLTSAGERGGT